MGFKKFCPKCGKETNLLVGKICADCFLMGKKLFTSKKPNISQCKNCQRLFLSGEEKHFNKQIIEDYISKHVTCIAELEQSKVLVEIEQKTELDYIAEIKVEGLLTDKLVEQKKIINFALNEVNCDACMKLNSDYREAIIQIRSENKENKPQMLDLVETFLKKENVKDPLSGASKIIELKNGYDFWIGSKKAAVKVARYLEKLYKTKMIVSKKLIGEEKSGQRKYRHTFCLKMD